MKIMTNLELLNNGLHPTYAKAFDLAISAHQGQAYGEKQHIDHVWDVCGILVHHIDLVSGPYQGLSTTPSERAYHEVLLAAICHDVIEDSSYSYADVKDAIGVRAADIVYNVTNELGKNRKERAAKTYPKIASDWLAIIVKLADRIANVTYSKSVHSSMFHKYQMEHREFARNLDRRSGNYSSLEGSLWSSLEKAFDWQDAPGVVA